ncbi:Zinc finger CCCH domain containing protein 3 [Echinococcus multilocularis]|uniref:Zinc finger CCCH domain containing protein 3 n=1 Tax=Echinococcus multilocularis TaxID=6211 RepID=A0A068YF75_ECHMU|nr:Zinc finger CCCH domain containing protein 3 [Echinococcus multilocularis]
MGLVNWLPKMSSRWSRSNSGFLTRAVYKFRRNESPSIGTSDFSGSAINCNRFSRGLGVSSRYRFRKIGYKSPTSSRYPSRTPGGVFVSNQVGSTEISTEDCLESTSLHQQCDATFTGSVLLSDSSPHNRKYISSAHLPPFRSKYKIHYKRPAIMQKARCNSSSVKSKQSHKSFRQRLGKSVVRTISPYKLRVKKAIAMLRYEKPICSYYVKTGRCRNEKNCCFSHDPDYLRLCPKFLQHSCLLGEQKCPLAHVLDPCRLPQCEFFATGKCHRDDCPFLHVTYPENTPMCPKFIRGRCEQGRECTKRHVWRSQKRSEQLATQNTSSSNVPKANDAPVVRVRRVECLRDVYPVPDFIPFILDD